MDVLCVNVTRLRFMRKKSRDSNGRDQFSTLSQIDHESIAQTFNVSANVLMTRTSGMSGCRSVYTHHFDVKLVNYEYVYYAATFYSYIYRIIMYMYLIL